MAHRPNRLMCSVRYGLSVAPSARDIHDGFLVFLRVRTRQQAPFSAKAQPLGELVERLRLVGRRGNLNAQVEVREILEQEDGADHPPDFPKHAIDTIVAAVTPQLAQQPVGRNLPLLNGDEHLEHIFPVGFDHGPVDALLEERINMLIARLLIGAVEHQILPVPQTRHQFEAQQKGQRERRQVLALGIGVDGVRP